MTVRKTDLLIGGGEFLRRWTRSVRFTGGDGGGGGAGRCRIKDSVATRIVVAMVASLADFPHDIGSDDGRGEEGGEMFSPLGASELHNAGASDDKTVDDDEDDGG